MKQTIRRGVFETNSSSVHALTLKKDTSYEAFITPELGPYLMENGLMIGPRPEGWQWPSRHIQLFEMKLNELVADIFENGCGSDGYDIFYILTSFASKFNARVIMTPNFDDIPCNYSFSGISRVLPIHEDTVLLFLLDDNNKYHTFDNNIWYSSDNKFNTPHGYELLTEDD